METGTSFRIFCQIIRVISSPSSSTIGLETTIRWSGGNSRAEQNMGYRQRTGSHAAAEFTLH